VRRETSGRGGKTVTTIDGVALASDALATLAGEPNAPAAPAYGARLRDRDQGDHRTQIVALLEQRGYVVKLAGG
jgi:translation initiation factor 1